MNRIFFIIVLMVSHFMIMCAREDSVAVDSEKAGKLPDQEIWDFQAKSTVNGKLEALIRAGHMQRYSREDLMLFDSGVQVDFFDEAGEHASVLTSDRGEYNSQTEDVKAIGNVVVVSDSGVTMYTDELFYYRKTDQIISTTNVKVETEEGHILYGVGFQSDAQMSKWQINQPHDGVAPEGLDLSLDRFEKREHKDSAGIDSTMLIDSTLVRDSTSVVDTVRMDSTLRDTVEIDRE